MSVKNYVLGSELIEKLNKRDLSHFKFSFLSIEELQEPTLIGGVAFISLLRRSQYKLIYPLTRDLDVLAKDNREELVSKGYKEYPLIYK